MMTRFVIFFYIIVRIFLATRPANATTAIPVAVDSACEIPTCTFRGEGCRQCTESTFSCPNRHLTGICNNFYNDHFVYMMDVNVANNDIANFLSFPTNSNITELDLSNNKFTTFSRDDFARFPKLQKLRLSGNRMVSKTLVKEVFDQVPFLEALWLANMDLTDLPENIFKNNKRLAIIDLASNKFAKIPRNIFKSGNHLETLILNNNPIEELEKRDLKQVQKLKKLQLENTNIRMISAKTFWAMLSLLDVDLDHNSHLEFIDEDAFGFFTKVPGHFTSNLKSVTVRGCNLHSLDEHTLNYLGLEEFGISENPWTCDCELQWMFDLEYWRQSAKFDDISAEFNKTRCSNEPFKNMTLSAVANNHKLTCFSGQLQLSQTARFSETDGLTMLLLGTLLVCAISVVPGVLTYRYFTSRATSASAVNPYLEVYIHEHLQTGAEVTNKEKIPLELHL